MVLILPPDFPVGIIIGKLGANIKNVQERSGARVYLDTPSRRVTFRGTSFQVQTARNMIEEQIKKWRPTIVTNSKDTAHKDTAPKELHPHPCLAAIVLSPNFEDTVTNSPNIRFKDVHTPKSTARVHKEQLYCLDLNAPTGDGDELAKLAKLATDFGRFLNFGYGATTSSGMEDRIFYIRNSYWSNVMPAYQYAVKTAADCERPLLNRLKLRINFGTQLFYTKNEAICRVPQSCRVLKLSDVLGLAVGSKHNLKACYSNEVSSTTIDRMRMFLSKLGFTPSLVSDAILCRGKDMTKTQDLNFKFDFGDVDEAGKRQIRCTNIRSNYTKLAIVSFIHPTIKNITKDSDQTLDFRCRLLGESPISEKKISELMSLAEGCTWSKVAKKVKSNLGEFERTCYKKKELFTGTFKGIMVEVGLMNVTDDSGWHWEVEVVSPDCDANLTDRNRVDKLIAFCNKLRTEAIK